jgi:hypothetical protein
MVSVPLRWMRVGTLLLNYSSTVASTQKDNSSFREEEVPLWPWSEKKEQQITTDLTLQKVDHLV